MYRERENHWTERRVKGFFDFFLGYLKSMQIHHLDFLIKGENVDISFKIIYLFIYFFQLIFLYGFSYIFISPLILFSFTDLRCCTCISISASLFFNISSLIYIRVA